MRVALSATMLATLLSTAAGCAAAPAATLPTAPPTPVTAASMPAHPSAMPQRSNRPKPIERVVDLNSASRKELMTLPGVGPAQADKIIKNRPYLTKTELVSKGVLPTGPFLSLRHQVAAIPPGLKPPAARTQNAKPSSREKTAKAPSPATAIQTGSPKATP